MPPVGAGPTTVIDFKFSDFLSLALDALTRSALDFLAFLEERHDL